MAKKKAEDGSARMSAMMKRLWADVSAADRTDFARKGGSASRKNQADGGTALGKRAVQARWARWRKANGKPPKPGDEEFLT